MRKIIFCLLILSRIITFAQKDNAPPLPPPPPPNRYDTVYHQTSNDSNKVYDLVAIQVVPEFPGGDKGMFSFLQKNIHYSDNAKNLGVQGKAFISFVVDKSGNVTKVEMYKGIIISDKINGKKIKKRKRNKYISAANELNEEALRVVRLMPKWKPGFQNEKPVLVKFILPIVFKLQ